MNVILFLTVGRKYQTVTNRYRTVAGDSRYIVTFQDDGNIKCIDTKIATAGFLEENQPTPPIKLYG